MLDEREQGIVEPSANVLDPSRREVVHADDAVLFHDQLFAQVRTDHPCSAGNENFHGGVLLAKLRGLPVGRLHARGEEPDAMSAAPALTREAPSDRALWPHRRREA